MKQFKKVFILFLISFGIIFIFQATNGISAFTTTPPDHYSSSLTTGTTYEYRVIEFDGPVYWWTEGKYLYTTDLTGLISIKLLGFADQLTIFWASNLNPVPFCNITSQYLDSGVLKENCTFANKSTTEIGSTLILGYNDYNPGFITSINWTHEKLLANNSIDPMGWIPGSVNFDESNPAEIKMIFKQDPARGNQNTTLIYNRDTGVLIYAKTEIFIYNLYRLEIQLKEFNISGYPLEIFSLLCVISLIAVVLVKKRNSFKKKYK